MATVVSVSPYEGVLRRYEIGGEACRLTHIAHAPEDMGRPVVFSVKVIEDFRLMPDPAFAVEPPPRPTNPPAAAGRIAAAA